MFGINLVKMGSVVTTLELAMDMQTFSKNHFLVQGILKPTFSPNSQNLIFCTITIIYTDSILKYT